ncbi:hypothetical protein KIV56_12535 [Cryobacterium breve]|uniref:SRPBCC family protein n=1 Tax=Cryobacterium breve TaxID=1259258 RepID=A0ABY7NAH6_9MICO|nr:hypothetical protein [Cryobacterium breve]WBM79270.1 hypothetical protein KIV56_12535 [Cryobacterium breve]
MGWLDAAATIVLCPRLRSCSSRSTDMFGGRAQPSLINFSIAEWNPWTEAHATTYYKAFGVRAMATDSGQADGSERPVARGRRRALVGVLITLVTVGAVLLLVGHFLGRGFILTLIGVAALSCIVLFNQWHVMTEMRTAMCQVDPGATVILGQLARTSPSPAMIAGFHASSSTTKSTWQMGISIRTNSVEMWAWDSRTPRRAVRIARSSIRSVTIDWDYVMTLPRDCLRIEWTDHGTTQWIKFAPIDVDRTLLGFMKDAALEQVAAELRNATTGSRTE